MAGFRVFARVVCVIFVGVGLVNGEEGVGEVGALGEDPRENPVILGGVEICGPIYDALLFLGPKDDSGKLDPDWIGLLPHPSGLQSVFFPPLAYRATEFAGIGAESALLGEFNGRTQRVVENWMLDGEVLRNFWSVMNERLRSLKGKPVEESDGFAIWVEGALRTIITLDAENGFAEIHHECFPTAEEYWARVRSVSESEGPSGPSKASSEFRPSEKVLGTPLLSVLGAHGEPDGGPYRRGPETLGLYFEGVEFLGIPCNTWFWFIEGETVYRGAEFAPPFGAKRALEAFRGFSEPLSGWYGKPFVTIGGEGFDLIENRWLNGSEETILRLEMADDPPWFRFEVIDREKIDTIEGDLRPDRKPVPGYVPPPKDSGKTRPDVVIGSARG
jgi:hypothetical protein